MAPTHSKSASANTDESSQCFMGGNEDPEIFDAWIRRVFNKFDANIREVCCLGTKLRKTDAEMANRPDGTEANAALLFKLFEVDKSERTQYDLNDAKGMQIIEENVGVKVWNEIVLQQHLKKTLAEAQERVGLKAAYDRLIACYDRPAAEKDIFRKAKALQWLREEAHIGNSTIQEFWQVYYAFLKAAGEDTGITEADGTATSELAQLQQRKWFLDGIVLDGISFPVIFYLFSTYRFWTVYFVPFVGTHIFLTYFKMFISSLDKIIFTLVSLDHTN
jgi:hypothetical protein